LYKIGKFEVGLAFIPEFVKIGQLFGWDTETKHREEIVISSAYIFP
jgi:hypothetical protein